jgi:hypothetical protein
MKMTSNLAAVEMKELNVEEIDAVGGGMLAHLMVVAGVTVLAFGILAGVYANSSKDYGTGTCNTDGTYTQ